MRRTRACPVSWTGAAERREPVARLGNRGGAGLGVNGRIIAAEVERRLGEYRSCRKAVLVDQPAEDVDAFDACVRIGARLDCSSRGDRNLEVDAAVKPVLLGSARAGG
jgi:hypothetical protein